jgi:hypothetical protein
VLFGKLWIEFPEARESSERIIFYILITLSYLSAAIGLGLAGVSFMVWIVQICKK